MGQVEVQAGSGAGAGKMGLAIRVAAESHLLRRLPQPLRQYGTCQSLAQQEAEAILFPCITLPALSFVGSQPGLPLRLYCRRNSPLACDPQLDAIFPVLHTACLASENGRVLL